MKSLAHLLGASARMDLLRALRHQHDAVGLRQLAPLAGVHPHSAERMLKDLVAERLVSRHNAGLRALFRKTSDHPDWQVLKAVFDAADCAVRQRHLPDLNRRAQSILPLIEEAGTMLRRARRSVRVA